jgi:hypothetical protein
MYYSVNQLYTEHEFIASFNISEYPLSKSQHDNSCILHLSEVSNIHYFVTNHKKANFDEKKT